MNRPDKSRREEKDYGFLHDVRRDWKTIRTLRGKSLLRYIWDYYKVPIFVTLFSLFAIVTIVNIVREGQRQYRLQVCVVLNTDDYCQDWFDRFADDLTDGGTQGAIDVNYDQPFDYDNMYYYVMEMEVMTTVSSRRMDVAICGEDMYSYLLALNACLPLDKSLPQPLLEQVSSRLVQSTANLKYDENNEIDYESGIDGYFALDLEGTEFEAAYNQPGPMDDDPGPLYAVVLSNTEHTEDAFALLDALTAR